MPGHPTPIRFNRILLTGAAGGLERELRARLKAYCTTVRLSHIADLGEAQSGEELCPARQEDAAGVHALQQDVDTVARLGGVSTEQLWEPILRPNIIGACNLYKPAREHGVKHNRVSQVTVFNFSVPVFGAVLSAIFLGEALLEWKNLLALVLVCVGIWLVTRDAPAPKESAPAATPAK